VFRWVIEQAVLRLSGYCGPAGPGRAAALDAVGTAFPAPTSRPTQPSCPPCGRVAIVDRLSFNATIIETGTDSYCLARTRAEGPAKAG